MQGNKNSSNSLEMYKEHILDLYKNPINSGKLEKPTHKHKEVNSLCGDDITIYLSVKNNIVKDIKFTAKGCAISIASASLITEKIKGMNIDEVRNLDEGSVKKLLKIPIIYTRIKCALLPLEAVKGAIKHA